MKKSTSASTSSTSKPPVQTPKKQRTVSSSVSSSTGSTTKEHLQAPTASAAGSRSSTPGSRGHAAIEDFVSSYTAAPGSTSATPLAQHLNKELAANTTSTAQSPAVLISQSSVGSMMGTDNVPTLRQLQESVVGGGDGAQTQFQMQRLGDNLDKWTGLMKNAIMSDFLAMSREHMGELGKMRDTHGGEVERLRVELAATVLARDKAKSSLARKERIVDKLVLTNLVGPTKSLAKRMFNTWRLRCVKAASIATSSYVFSNHIARQHYRKTLKRKVMAGWVQDVMKMTWKKRLEREAKANFNVELANVRQDYDGKIAQLLADKAALERKLGTVFDERERYAEEMKQALLRGVCALNIETMSVFGQQGQGPDTLPDPHVMPANDELPFRTDEDEQQRFRATLKTSIPHKDPTWFNHQTLQEQRHQAANALATAQEQRAASPAASSRLVSHYAHIPAPQVLPHRHVSDYASLHQPPPPPPSLLRHPNPGSLHVVDQYADSRGVTTASPEVAPVQAQAPSARTASPARAPRARSPDHGNIYHNFKNSSVGAGVPHSTAGSARATGRVIRPVVEQARGPIGLVTVRGNGKPASAAGGASRSIRVERHGRP